MSTPVEETLAYEAEKRPRAATIAVLAGTFTVVGNVLVQAFTTGAPRADDGLITFGESLGAHLDGRRPEGTSLTARITEHFGDNAPLLSIGTVLGALGLAALALTLLFLFRATYARSEVIGRLPYYAALAGLLLTPLGQVLRQIPQWIAAAGFEGTTAGEARDALQQPITGIGQILEQLGIFALALALVLIALNAMRVGLLTRFLGILGMISGALLLLSQFDPPGIVRAFWLFGVGLLIAGRIKTPPAWETGRAEPWPTQQQLREQRGGGTAAESEAEEPARPVTPDPDAPTPAQARKKRKHRR